jgi:broad specificity phosphatase PhoE
LATKIIFLCHGPTRAMREGAFPDPDEGLDAGGARKAVAADLGALRFDRAVSSPAAAALETAAALGLDAAPDEGLRDAHHGRWTGKSITALLEIEPQLVAAWLADPGEGAPQGEPLAALAVRVGEWIEGWRDADARILAITHPAVIRAAVAHVLQCPPSSCLRIDVAPLSRAAISFNGVWRLQELGAPPL